ncbi:hypothetical protein I0D68_20075 [Pseudomonas lalucatii]|nr:hypothetical protein I0D68_20075 [Pseudomonas lalucatii]
MGGHVLGARRRPAGGQPAALQAGLCAQIDTAADAARRAVAGDPLRAVEYDRAAAEAQAFAAAGYPEGAVPRTVAAWAINGRSAQQAADSILAEAAAYTEALYQIREARLQARSRCARPWTRATRSRPRPSPPRPSPPRPSPASRPPWPASATTPADPLTPGASPASRGFFLSAL